jgi:hypothetical protein
MEVFMGSYKDGTEEGNKRDYRFIAGLYLAARITIGASWLKDGPNTPLVQSYAWLVTTLPYVISAVCFAFFKPHRKMLHNFLDVLFFLLMVKICIIFHVIFDD